ncbi:MAG: PD40 domain-containing protein [Verrucomicrobia bacterium]|nr:PD40 domain-containing protein [Verrucomicrobiota bacterium]
MKSSLPRTSWIRLGLPAISVLLVAGCLKDRLAWSPDGRRAAVVTSAGLHLTDADGRLTPLLVPGVYRAAWLPDSRSLLLARTRPVRNFAEMSAALGPERSRALASKAEDVWKRLKDLPRKEFDKRASEEVGEDLAGILGYLREQPAHLAGLRAKLGPDWKSEEEGKPLDLHELIVGRLNGDTLVLGTPLHLGLPAIQFLRATPDGRVVALATATELSPHPDNGIRLLVVPTDGSQSATVVATQSTAAPDWTPDGRSLVFFKGSGAGSPEFDLRLGTLVERTILGSDGQIRPAAESVDLAGLIFSPGNKVHCLRDGRVVFNAAPFCLPAGINDEPPHEQLYVLDRAAKGSPRGLIDTAALSQLPKTLSAFVVSPDEKQVLIADENGAVWLHTLATSMVESITPKLERHKGSDAGENYPMPAWRAPGEFTFLRQSQPGAPFELVLRRGTADTVLSRAWDPAVFRKLLE